MHFFEAEPGEWKWETTLYLCDHFTGKQYRYIFAVLRKMTDGQWRIIAQSHYDFETRTTVWRPYWEIERDQAAQEALERFRSGNEKETEFDQKKLF